jgi:hypothetical protein
MHQSDINVMKVKRNFHYLDSTFFKGMILEVHDNDIIKVWTYSRNGTIAVTPFLLYTHTNKRKKIYYNTTRFIFECHKNLSLIKFRK